MTPNLLALLPIGALLIGAGLVGLSGRLLASRGKAGLALVSALVALGGVIAAWAAVLAGGALESRWLPWDGPFSLAYHVDGLSVLFALTAAGIGAAVLLYSRDYMASDPAAGRFYALMLAFIAGFIHLVYSADLFALYVSWELIGLCSFLLVGFWYRDAEAARGARKVLVMTHLTGYGLLAAILAVFVRSGITAWTDPRLAEALTTGLFLLILAAAAAKSVQFPLHTWIPDAMAAPTPVSALLHSACYVTAGVYLIARLHSIKAWPATWGQVVMAVALATMVVGALYALVQRDLKRLLAFSTVSQIGYMMLGLGLGTPLGIAAALLHCLNHAFFKGGLFLAAGAVQHAAGTRDLDRLGGLAGRMPRTALFWAICAGSLAGVPLMSGFASKWLLYNAALEAGQVAPALIAWLVSLVTVFYMLKASAAIFLGPESAAAAKAHGESRAMLWGMGLLSGVSVLLGVLPQLAVQVLINPLLPAVGAAPVGGVSWLGLSTGIGSWQSVGGLALALLAVGGGLLVYFLARPGTKLALEAGTASIGGGTFTGGEPLTAPGSLPASDFSAVVASAWAPFYPWTDVDRLYSWLWRAILSFSRGAQQLADRLLARPLAWLAALAAAAVLLLAWGAGGQVGGGLEGALPPALALACGVGWLALCAAAWGSVPARRSLGWMLAAGAAALGGLLVANAWLRLALLEGASLLVWAALWRSDVPARTTRLFLGVIVLSAGLLAGGLGLETVGMSAWARALTLTGLALKLGLIPFFFWLPEVCAAAPAALAGLLVSVIDMAVFGELWGLGVSAPEWFFPQSAWRTLAVLSALLGALLMLAQRDLKRLLAFSTLEDLGYLLFAVSAVSPLGYDAALYGAAAHALAKALLFGALVAPEQGGAVNLERRGLASRYPLSAAAFLIGTLTILGVPPMIGFVGRWRVYAIAMNANGLLGAALFVASGLALLAYTRVLARVWWGVPGEALGAPESKRALAVLILTAIVALLVGLWPGILPALAAWIGG